MVCDHDATRSSLRVFLAATEQHDFHDFGDKTLLFGNCRGCTKPLAVEVDLARGHVVHGEIGAVPAAPHEDLVIGAVRAPSGINDNEGS